MTTDGNERLLAGEWIGHNNKKIIKLESVASLASR